MNTPLHPIYFGSLIESDLQELLTTKYAHSKIAVLCDENTYEHCLGFLMNSISGLENAEILQIEPGEASKDVEVLMHLVSALTEYEFGRNDLLINLGGGVVTDLGAFLSTIYKRGMNYIHIPTSLLAMVDASIGGKNGIDFGPYKNQIGTFSYPEKLFIDPNFLQSLPEVELLSGFAEAIKHACISDAKLFDELENGLPSEWDVELIQKVVQVKLKVVENDPREKNERKKLNFGHTFGHALEGWALSVNPISHGHGVAIGIAIESSVSYERGLLDLDSFERILKLIARHYSLIELDDDSWEMIGSLLRNDKKNAQGEVLSCLLDEIGICLIDQRVVLDDFKKAYDQIKAYF